jgi:cytochrome c-L
MRLRSLRAVSAAACVLLFSLPGVAQAPRFYNQIEGTPLDLSKEPETPAVKAFKLDGRNPYNKDPVNIKKGETLFATACSGCHGHHAEGKLGPGLADDYWTYPKNNTDPGLFSSIYGGLSGSMGPQRGRLTPDEILQLMAWVRSIYQGDPAKAAWTR